MSVNQDLMTEDYCQHKGYERTHLITIDDKVVLTIDQFNDKKWVTYVTPNLLAMLGL